MQGCHDRRFGNLTRPASRGHESGWPNWFTTKTLRTQREKAMDRSKEQIEPIAQQLVDSMLKVHRALGPGLLESTYPACLTHALHCRGIEVVCEVALPIRYGAIEIEAGYRIDMLVAGCIIIENKAVQELLPVHEAQLLTYLKLSGHRLGFLVNWNVPLIKDGIQRMVNGI
jgi:GxxExxY protein